jgi:acyl-CoA thioesterase YciA
LSTGTVQEPVIRIIAMPADANAEGDIFGGWLMSLMDMGAGLVAARKAGGRVVTVAMDGMQFLLPVKVGDEVSVFGTLERVGRTSIKVAIEAWRRSRYSEERFKVTEARFTFVALDEDGRPRPVEQE